MSVDQFLFQANQYISVSDGMEVSQTFSTSKEFHTIALRVSNATGSENDSRYEIALYDGDGKLLQTRELLGEETSDYAFYAMDFESVQGVSDYEIRIRKTDGKQDLIFLYYDTGHYDVYPEGKLSGITMGDMADLAFEVYEKQE